ncbi:MAG: hypothetical protein ACF788_00715, partial [Novipirellula sp. JB048]
DRAMKTGRFDAFQVVPKEYRVASGTPLSIQISGGEENTFREEIGAAVKEKDVVASAAGASEAEYVPMGES